ncbi:MAG: triose-phosphate isomerase [Acidobacteria bacterium]|jgi:triosephosphate isomerase|nr:triose-phosphate isomerase [Acidobacteriota bacterium]
MKDMIIAGNWKMFKNVAESIAFIQQLEQKIEAIHHFPGDRIEILVFPAFTSLYAVKDISKHTKIGAQNFHYEEQGAYTGEISPLMLENIVDYVLIGHSERRQLFYESDESVNRKIKTALHHNFKPILCIGETLSERESGKTFSRIEEQLTKGLTGLNAAEVSKVVIAYEPIWAIGTGRNATPDQAQEAHAFIREILKEKNGQLENMRILYGGSVKPENSFDILSKNDINGVLVGGASLKIETFSDIIHYSVKLVNLSIR